jgi:hypothetical protein
MPNTLGVSADPSSLHEPLFTGFAEDLFSGLPRLIHSLDLTAEDTDSEAYRDLLREIDRAFQSFDHMAVRHGWLSGGETQDVPIEQTVTGIDLPAFVASVLIPHADAYRVPTGWASDLDGLPGFDRATNTVRLANDPAQLRDTQGRELLYPGRSHPLTRRAIASVRSGRVSAAKSDTLSLLMTYTVEIGSVFRDIVALRLYPDGSVTEQTMTLPDQPAPWTNLWHQQFANWAPTAIMAADATATGIAERIVSKFEVEYRERVARDTAVARTWLERRIAELCGATVPWIGDLFDTTPDPNDWHACPVPEQRLSAFAADPSMPSSKRREAAEVLARFHNVIESQSPLPPPSVRPLGLLMLVP